MAPSGSVANGCGRSAAPSRRQIWRLFQLHTCPAPSPARPVIAGSTGAGPNLGSEPRPVALEALVAAHEHAAAPVRRRFPDATRRAPRNKREPPVVFLAEQAVAHRREGPPRAIGDHGEQPAPESCGIEREPVTRVPSSGSTRPLEPDVTTSPGGQPAGAGRELERPRNLPEALSIEAEEPVVRREPQQPLSILRGAEGAPVTEADLGPVGDQGELSARRVGPPRRGGEQGGGKRYGTGEGRSPGRPCARR